MQELDLATGLVRYEWHSLDHVAARATPTSRRARAASRNRSTSSTSTRSTSTRDGDLLIDARNTWAAYDVDRRAPARCAGGSAGRRSSFKLGPGTVTAYQHDAREQPNGNITFFDNGATPKVHPQSRVIELALEHGTR